MSLKVFLPGGLLASAIFFLHVFAFTWDTFGLKEFTQKKILDITIYKKYPYYRETFQQQAGFNEIDISTIFYSIDLLRNIFLLYSYERIWWEEYPMISRY